MHHQYTMKTIAVAYLRNQEFSVKETIYHMLPELKLKKTFPAVCFVKINLPEERVQVLLSEKELTKLPDDSLHILMK